MSEKLRHRIQRAKRINALMTGVFTGIGGFFLGLIIVLAGYIIIFWALLISVPLGVLAGIYMAEYAGDTKLTRFIRVCIESLSSLPSIVIGLFGYLVFILMTGARWNLFAGALAVSILSLPSVTTTTEDAMRSLPKSYKAGSMALGATHWVTIVKVLLPACTPRIVTGVILAAGRGFGEAAALLYTAGQSTRIVWNNWNLSSVTCPLNPFRPGETLALHIWVMRTEGALNPNSEKIACHHCSCFFNDGEISGRKIR